MAPEMEIAVRSFSIIDLTSAGKYRKYRINRTSIDMVGYAQVTNKTQMAFQFD